MLVARAFTPPSPEARRIAAHGNRPRRVVALTRTVMAGLSLILLLAGCSDSQDTAKTHDRTSLTEKWASGLAISDPSERTVALTRLVANVDAEDGPELAGIATDMFRQHRMIDDLILIDAWTRANPLSASRYAMQASAAHGDILRQAMARRWASIDPKTLIESIIINDRAVEIAIINGWYSSGLPGIEDYVLSAGASIEGQARIASYVEELRRDKGGKAVANWLDMVRLRPHTPPLVVTQSHRKGMTEMVMDDPDLAIEYCELHCEEPYADVARVRIADRMGMVGEGRKALDWIAASKDAKTEDRKLAARVAFRGYLRTDTEAALEWVNTARPNFQHEEWFGSLALVAFNVIGRRTPEQALPWLDALEESTRETSAIKIGKRWMQLDPPAAKAWLENSDLSPAAIAEVLAANQASAPSQGPSASNDRNDETASQSPKQE